MLLWLLAALIVLLVVLSLGRSPATAATPPPSAAQVQDARQVYGRLHRPGDSVSRELQFTWAELAAVAMLGGRAAGFERVSFQPADGVGHLQVSHPLPAGFWFNGHVYIEPDQNGQLQVSARMGHLPVPSFLVHTALGAGIRMLRMRGANIGTLHEMVSRIRLDNQGIAASVNLPADARVVSALSGLRADGIDPERVSAHYCRLVETQRATPDASFAAQVRRAFSSGDGTVPDNRAAFIALSLLSAQIDAGALPDGKRPLFERCGKVDGRFQLQGRTDLAKHWAVSAALTASLGTDASLALGTWKEIADSGAGGSGFSLVDLAADRSGVFVAQRGADPQQALELQQWLGSAPESDLLPVSALALAEGMTEGEFRARFTDTESAAFAATVQRLDGLLAVLMPKGS